MARTSFPGPLPAELTCPGFQGAGRFRRGGGCRASRAEVFGGRRGVVRGAGEDGCRPGSAWKWSGPRTRGPAESACGSWREAGPARLPISSLIPSSGGYGHFAGAVLPPVPAALRWDADVQPPAGLHRVAHHPGGPAWLRPFRLLSHCILLRWRGARCLRVGRVEGYAGLCPSHYPHSSALLLNSLNPGLQ